MMTDFLNCQTPLYDDLAADLGRVLADRRTSKLTRDNAQRSLAAVDDLNTVLQHLRAANSEARMAQDAADELRELLKQRQQELTVTNNFKSAYDALRSEFDALETNIEAETARRVSAALAPLRADVSDAKSQQYAAQTEIANLERKLAAASKDNHFTDARVYGGALLIGAAAGAAVVFLAALPYMI